ncbi:MAG: HWE histidine kinase domain-containing protein [Planctomycetota bacterium]
MLRWIRQRIAVQLALTAGGTGLIAAVVLTAADWGVHRFAHDDIANDPEHLIGLVVGGVAEAVVISAIVYAAGWMLWGKRIERLIRGVESGEIEREPAIEPHAGQWGDEIDRLGVAIGRFIREALDNEQRLQALVAELSKTERHLQEAQSLARLGSWEYDPGGSIHWWSREVYRIFGHDPAGPPPALQEHLLQYHMEDRKRLVESLERSVKNGQPYHGRYRILPDGRTQRWVEAHAYAQLDERGKVERMTGTVQDITAQVEREQDLQRLTRELNHRVKNNLSTIIALTRQSAESSDSVEALASRLIDRLKAMALAHEMVVSNRPEATSLELIVSAMTRVHGKADTGFDIDGPFMDVAPDAATPLALTLHELANNAAKHGALSQAGGIVRVRWSPTDDGGLTIEWAETLPNRIDTDFQEGDGLGLARGFIEHQLSGRIGVLLTPHGVRLRIELPPAAVDQPIGDANPVTPQPV